MTKVGLAAQWLGRYMANSGAVAREQVELDAAAEGFDRATMERCLDFLIDRDVLRLNDRNLIEVSPSLAQQS